MKTHCLAIAYLLAVLPVIAQEPDKTTNAFDDLKRKGAFSSHLLEMQVPASAGEMKKLYDENPKCNYFLFAEDRAFDIVMDDHLPKRWLERDKSARMQLDTSCAPGEFFTFQIGVYSPYQELKDLNVSFGDFKNENGKKIKSEDIECFNLGGVDTQGETFSKRVDVSQNKVQPLWVGVRIPADAEGRYKGQIKVKPKNATAQKVTVYLNVQGAAVVNQGDDEGWRKGRLRWLNSTIGVGEQPTAPYTAVRYENNRLDYLGGQIELGKDGLPEKISTCYDESNLLDATANNPVLAEKMRFVIETPDGNETLVPKGKLHILKQTDANVTWKTVSRSKNFELTVTGTFGFDGHFRYVCAVKSLTGKSVKDIRLEVPYTGYAARYMMGLGRKGGYRPQEAVEWKWNVDKHQDKVWMGNVNAGLNFIFKDEKYVRPLVNIYYSLGKLNLPESWGNRNKGGIHIQEAGDKVMLTAYSGERKMPKGETLFYNFDMLVTPVKPLNLEQLSTVRFYHSNSDLSKDYIPAALKAGATAINIHHKKEIYPFINYPYYDEAVPDLKAFADEAHAKGLKMRLYYTTRELTVKVPELWALRSLGSEVIHDGPGKDARTLIHSNGPHEWLNKNLKTHFIPAWYNAFGEGKYKGDMDLSVITTPDSRWNNYYLEGLNWMVKNLGLDGVYIDDSALDRQTLQRARRVLDADGSERLIDIHSWNHNNEWAGYANSLHIYLELLPYVDRTWIGEGFSANNTHDFWLVEMSGIPFGLMSETLDAHNIWRGMAFGMLPRLPWSGNPVPMWKFWDDFGMKDATFIGYWDSCNPVQCESSEIKASLFRNDKTRQTMVVLSNWSDTEQPATFRFKGTQSPAVITPCIEGLQDGSDIQTIKPKSGAIFILQD